MNRATFFLAIVAWIVPAVSKSAEDTLSLDEVAERQVDPGEAPLERARDQLDRRRFAEAASSLAAIIESDPPPEIRDEATYLLGKALYRLELYHAALDYFARILELGPDGRYFDAAMEWCLFIGRKMVDDAAVSETLAQYGSSDFPEPYRDEFLFRLARHHFAEALADERAARLPAVSQSDDEGVSFAGDLFGTGGDGGAGSGASRDKSPGGEGRISIGRDLFGTGGTEPEPSAEVGGGDDGGISIEGDPFGASGSGVSAEGSLSTNTHLTQAERFALRVDSRSEYGAKAKFIEALVLFERNRENEALTRFKDVVRLTRPDQPYPDDRLRELAFFQLARTHFGAQQPTFSTFYYSKVDRNSSLWLDALFEDSWAQFRLGNYEKALGNLLTLHAPFFEESYYPESRILEAVIYYENCRYREANRILARFLSRYEPILEELRRITRENSSAEDYLGVLDELEHDDLASAGGDQAAILSQILQIALADPELERLARSRAEVRAERERAEALSISAPLSAELGAIYGRQVADRSARAGRAVEQRLVEERENIKSLVQQAIRIDIETARSEQERIESRLRSVQSRPRKLEKTFVGWTDDEKVVWPFDGEYWRDELGTYELVLARSCR